MRRKVLPFLMIPASMMVASCSDDSKQPTLSAPKDPLQVRVVVLRKATVSATQVDRFVESAGKSGVEPAVAAALSWKPTAAEEKAFNEFRCGGAGSADDKKSLMVCDSAGKVYLLSPAALSGHVRTAKAAADSYGKWNVDVTYDSTGTSALAALSTELSSARGQQEARPVALQRAQSLLMSGPVMQPITNGQVRLGPYEQGKASQLARDIAPITNAG